MPHTHCFKEETMNARRTIIAWLASLAMAILLAPSIAGAEEMSYSALMSRIDALEQQLQQQHADFVSYEMGGAQKDDGDGKGHGKGKGNDSCPSWYAGYEATVLRAYLSDNSAALAGQPGYGESYGVGHRFTVGRDGGNGVGVRARYWMYNHGHNFLPGPDGITLDMDVLDLEATLQEEFCNFDILLSGGVRYGRVGFNPLGLGQLSFEGTGPTVSIQADREIGSRGIHLIGNVRASLLMGQITNPADVANRFQTIPSTHDDLTTVLESQLGIGWERETGLASCSSVPCGRRNSG
jgi:hypothetical protein